MPIQGSAPPNTTSSDSCSLLPCLTLYQIRGRCAARYGIITSTKGEMLNDPRMSILPGTDQDEHCDYIVSWLRIRKGKMLDLRTAFPLYAYVDEDGGRIGMEALPLRGLHRPCRFVSDCFSHRRHHHRRHIGICRHPISTFRRLSIPRFFTIKALLSPFSAAREVDD